MTLAGTRRKYGFLFERDFEQELGGKGGVYTAQSGLRQWKCACDFVQGGKYMLHTNLGNQI